MECYLVGGYVRDTLLGYPAKDKDWVVIGSTPKAMVKKGFRPVGKDFPVFLHPDTQEEYALARTERKHGHGYQGFTCYSSPDVTLEQDLARRDLTINAIAQTPTGDLIDPFNGQDDLRHKILRHVSPAFIEDPVRVLRLARFAAKFGFSIAEETHDLIQTMITNGELTYLVPERIWQELIRALQTRHPSQFFTSLRQLNALAILFPEIDDLFGVPQPAQWHPEIDTGIHVMLVLDQAAKLSTDPHVLFAALCHDLGKATTPADILPQHIGHEQRGVTITRQLCKRLNVPRAMSTLALKTAQYHTHVHRAFELKPKTILAVLLALDAFRKPQQFEHFLLACEADCRGRPGYETAAYPNKSYFQRCLNACRAIDIKPILQQGKKGKAIADALNMARIHAIRTVPHKVDR